MTRPGPRRLPAVLLLGVAAVIAALLLSCLVGAQPISLSAAFAGQEPDRSILFGLRLPRALLGAVVGLALAAAGTALQALLRNPLAEPFVLGVSGGGLLGGSVALVAGSLLGSLWPPLGALGQAPPVAASAVAGSFGATILVFALGRVGGRLVPEAALLVGIVFNAFAGALITILQVLLPPEEAARLLHWLLGTIGYQPPGMLAAAAVVVTLAVGTLVALSAQLNLLALGDEEAASLGVEVGRLRTAVLLAASAATGAAVALSGMVAFVGLIVPHGVRRLVGHDHRVLLPAAALFGAAFLVVADALARVAFLALGSEPPVGALTAFAGGPLFLWLLRRQQRG